MRFLMIENKGEAPITAFTVLGATNKKDSDIKGLIGTFGSGACLGTITLLRHGIAPTVFCGQTRMEFFTTDLEVKTVDDHTTNYKQVNIQFGGKLDGRSINRKEKLSWTTQWGSYDWKQIPFAMREYVSNAIDAMLVQGVPVEKVWPTITVEIVDSEDDVRAKSGYTRVFVPIIGGWQGEQVVKFYDNIGSWFLHAEEPESLALTVLEKYGRNIARKEGKTTARPCFYRRGVFVREFEHSDTPSLFDYNFNDLPMNESRTVDDHAVLNAAGEAIRKSSPEIIARVMKGLLSGKELWERGIGEYSLTPVHGDDRLKLQAVWTEALAIVAGENAVLVSDDASGEQVIRKGYKPVKLPEAFHNAARTMELRTEEKVLTEDDRRGRTYKDANPPLTDTLDRVWSLCEKHGMTNGKQKPNCRIFHEQMEAECERFGFYKDNMVSVHEDYCTAENDALDLTVLEEVAHHTTGATDNSRDFQQWLMRFIQVALLKKK